MEAIVLKVLKKYFKLFIKNFKSDNFSISLLKGEGTLVDLDLNETIIQDLLLIPPQYKVTHASCDQLFAKIPWTSYKKEPITISLQNIVINLKEPEIISPIQSQLKKFKKKQKNKRNEITETLQIEVKSLKLNIESLHGSTLMIEIENVLIQSTNSNFQALDLTQIKNIDKELGIESIHKVITAKSISIKIQDEGGMVTSLLESLPIKVLYSSKRRIKDWIQLSAKLEFILKNLNLNWTLTQWHSIMELVQSIQNSLARAVPLPDISQSLLKSSKDSKKKSSSTFKKSSSGKDKESILSPSSVGSSPMNVSPSISRLNQDSSSTPPILLGSSPMGTSSGVGSDTLSTSDPSLPIPKHSDFSYEFHIEKWALELIDDFSSAGNNFSFKGEGLHFAFTSANTICKPLNPETNLPYYQIPIRETILSAVIKSLAIQEISLNSSKKIELCSTNELARMNKKYDKTITSISSDAMPERIDIHNYTGPFLLRGNLIFRKPITITPPSTPIDQSQQLSQSPSVTTPIPIIDPLKLLLSGGPPLIGIELNLHLNDININGDRRSWKSFIGFLKPPEDDSMTSESESELQEVNNEQQQQSNDNTQEASILESSLGKSNQLFEVQDSPTLVAHSSPSHVGNNGATTATTTTGQSKSKVLIEKSKKKISSFKRKLKLGDNWKNQIKIILKATNTEVVVRDEKFEQFKGMELRIKLSSFVMRNHSEWKSVPYLLEGLQLADKSAIPDPITVSGLDHRVSFLIENVSIEFSQDPLEVGGIKLSPQLILSPSTISLYLRLSRSNTLNNRGKRIPKIDMSLSSLDFNFTMTSIQSEFLDHLANKYLSPKKMKNLLKSRIKKEAKKRLKSLEEKNLDKTITIKNKVEKTLQQYFWNCYIKIQKGHFHLPLQYLLEPKHTHQQQPSESTNNNIPQTLIETIISSPNSQIEKLSEIKVESLGLLLQNKEIGQNIIIKIGSVEANGIDHPKLSTSTMLRPLPTPEDEYIPSTNSDNTNLLITYSRKQQKFAQPNSILVDHELNEFITEVWVRLQGTQVRVMKKPKPTIDDPTHTESTSKKMKMPDIKNFITKAVNLLERRKDKIKDIKKGIKKVNLNLRWGVELGNCEILLGDKSKSQLNTTTTSDNMDWNDCQPKGIIKITDTNRKSNAKSYQVMEAELLKKKIEFVQTEEERDIHQQQITSLQHELDSMREMYETKLKDMIADYEALEKNLVSTKLKLAELM